MITKQVVDPSDTMVRESGQRLGALGIRLSVYGTARAASLRRAGPAACLCHPGKLSGRSTGVSRNVRPAISKGESTLLRDCVVTPHVPVSKLVGVRCAAIKLNNHR